MSTDELSLEELTEKLNQWCAEQNLVPASADEMLWYDDLTWEQSAWLRDFIDDWDEASDRWREEVKRQESEALASK